MAEPHVTFALKDKAYELRRLIVSYEEALEKARRDLAVVVSAIGLFETEGGKPLQFVDGVGVRNLFARGETWTICKTALQAEPSGLSTRQLAECCLGAKAFDHENPVLRRAMVADLVNTLRKKQRRYEVTKEQERDGSAVWRLKPPC